MTPLPAVRFTRWRAGLLRVLASVGISAWLVACASVPTATPSTAESLVAQVHLTASADSATFVATGALADFGVQDGVRLVTVRIVEKLQLSVSLESGVDLPFAEPPRLCLVGPYAAPDDAGLQDPCWGSPDVSALVQQLMPSLADGQPMLRAGQPLVVHVMLERGDERCDYPPGIWTLDLDGRPLVNGQAPARSASAPPAQFTVAIPPNEAALPYLKTDTTRYCGLATLIYRDQGEPATFAP